MRALFCGTECVQVVDVSMSVSTCSTCRAQSDSTQENHMLVALGKGDGKGEWWGSMTIREGRHGRGKEGRGMRGSHKVENKCDFSCCQKEAMSTAW